MLTGFKRTEIIKRGMLKERDVKWEFENEWVKIKWLKDDENIEDYIK